jgi:hypothetical protein
MRKAKAPADHNSESPEEARGRVELHLVWTQLVREHVFPKEDSVAGLANRLKAWQALESKDPSIGEGSSSFLPGSCFTIRKSESTSLAQKWLEVPVATFESCGS